ATRLAHQDQAGGEIPRLEIVLHKAVETASRNPGEVDGGNAGAAHAAGGAHQRLALGQKAPVACPAAVRDAGTDQPVGQALAVGHAQAPIVDKSALPALGGVKFIEDRVV